MFEIGKVVQLNKKQSVAVVEFPRKSACDSCHMCAFKKNEMTVKCSLANSLQAKIGDRVSVKMGDKFVLTASFVVYLVPVLLMLVALAVSQKLSIGWQIGLCALALALGFAVSLIVEKIVKTKKGFKPEMVEIITDDASLNCANSNADADNNDANFEGIGESFENSSNVELEENSSDADVKKNSSSVEEL